jgi:predicted permease
MNAATDTPLTETLKRDPTAFVDALREAAWFYGLSGPNDTAAVALAAMPTATAAQSAARNVKLLEMLLARLYARELRDLRLLTEAPSWPQ